jgi:hypothetical protein
MVKLGNRGRTMQRLILALGLLTVGMRAQFPVQPQKPSGPWMDKTPVARPAT